MKKQKLENLKISKEAKDIVYAEKKRSETYSEVIIRVFGAYSEDRFLQGEEEE